MKRKIISCLSFIILTNMATAYSCLTCVGRSRIKEERNKPKKETSTPTSKASKYTAQSTLLAEIFNENTTNILKEYS